MNQTIHIPASKSLSNRWLILQYLYPQLQIENLSSAQDTKVLREALDNIRTTANITSINIGHAGTAMRFLTALIAGIEGKSFILDGSNRMRQRPIGILVDALESLGGKISYLEQQGFPPIKISGTKLNAQHIEIPANVSSQYITALLLIAPKLPNGLHLTLSGNRVSTPYVDMTIAILKSIGVGVVSDTHSIIVSPAPKIKSKRVHIESDWSSASYFYGLSAIFKKEIYISSFYKNSLQGDSELVDIFSKFGIKSLFQENGTLLLRPIPGFVKPDFLSFDLLRTPDLAQTLAVTCLAMGIKCRLTGLQTLKIKETDRLVALQNEMQKLGANIHIDDVGLEIITPSVSTSNVFIDTYDDHRMAMSFALLKKVYPQINIKHPEVVVKSFPDFWEKIGLFG